MAQSFTGKKRIRKSFGRIPEAVRMPNLIEVQRSSYEQFLQREVRPGQRRDEGIEAVFKSVFPIKDFNERAMLEYVSYEFEEPKYDVEECIQRDMTYAAPLKVKLRLIVWETDEETQARSVKDIKEQDVYMGDIPLMTDKGTFVVNGTERVIVSQMHRSPGVFFDHDKGKTHSSGKLLFAARIIPYRGSWLDFEFDAKDVVYVRIDRRRKLPATTFLYALGMDGEEILTTFYDVVPFVKRDAAARRLGDALQARALARREARLPADRRRHRRGSRSGRDQDLRPPGQAPGRQRPQDPAAVARSPGRPLPGPRRGQRRPPARSTPKPATNWTRPPSPPWKQQGFTTIDVLDIDHVTVGAYIRNTLRVDKNAIREDALFDIYRVMRPGEPPTVEAAEAMFKSLFFDQERYDLSSVGRVKMNIRLELDCPDDVRVIRKEDVLEVLKTLVGLRDGRGEIDDIDNLGNRRVRSVGELLENQYRVGLLRMERAIKERMSSVDIDTVMPHDLINAKPAAASVREFFGSSQLSQFMDQTNPLSEITHKRRLSALGPGGLTRERAGFEVRDVHPTHYGRICPIETPEGPNIGLINSLATHAVVNKYGFIESPYRRVKDGKITDEVVYMSAMEEAKHVIAQANIALNNGEIVDDLVPGRINGEPSLLAKDQVDLMDVSPKQVVSVAAALIPFLENDDANRALMGSNMQRQAVPLIQSDAPLVGTGMEDVVARDSGAVVDRPAAGRRRTDRRHPHRHPGHRGDRPHQAGRRHLSPVQVPALQPEHLHQPASAGAGRRQDRRRRHHRRRSLDGPGRTGPGPQRARRVHAVERLQLRGLDPDLRAHRPRRRLHLDPHRGIRGHGPRHQAGPGGDHPRHPQRRRGGPAQPRRGRDRGHRRRGPAGRHPGRQGDAQGRKSPMTPEEKLLRAIFGEKASDVRDTSLRLPPGVAGTVVEVRVFNRHGVEKDERAVAIEREEIDRLGKDRDDEFAILNRNMTARLRELLIGKQRRLRPQGPGPRRDHRRTSSTKSRPACGGRSPSTTRRPWASWKPCAASSTTPASGSTAASRTRSTSSSAATNCPPA